MHQKLHAHIIVLGYHTTSGITDRGTGGCPLGSSDVVPFIEMPPSLNSASFAT